MSDSDAAAVDVASQIDKWVADGAQALQKNPIVQMTFLEMCLGLEEFASDPYLWQDKVCDDLNIKAAMFSKLLGKAKIRKVLGGIPQTVEQLIDMFVKLNKLSVTLDGRCIHSRPIADLEGATFDQVAHSVSASKSMLASVRILYSNVVPVTEPITWLRVQCENLRIPFAWAAVEAAFLAWVEQERRKRFHELYEAIGYHIGGEARARDEWIRWAKAVCEDVTDIELTICVMKSWIWQIKRKMAGETVNYHLMPIFVGRQGGGKSTAVAKFTAVLGEGVAKASFRDIEDSRKAELFHWFPVLVFDEMEHAARTDVECIKSRITESIIQYRPLFTNAIKLIDMRASLIGTSNRGVVEIINDPSGMRRFYQINCHDKMSFDDINGVDYMKLWQSVDEFRENPILEMMGELGSAQAQITASSNVHIWVVEGYNECRDENGNPFEYGEWYGVQKLFKAFSEWERVNIKPKNPTGRRGFCNRMLDLTKNGLVEKRVIGKNEVTEYRVKKEGELIQFPRKTAK